MYSVSDAFLRAVRSNTRKYFWTGTIVTKGGMTYEFGAKEIVKGSGYISRQCCGSTEIELGTVYAAEMGITLLSDIDRYTLEDALVTLVFHLVLADGSVEDVPMGVFEVSEANRLAKCLELKAYDFMLRFDKSFNGFETVGTAYDFIALCCKRCKVEFANKRAEIDAMPNGGVTLSVYTENDIETCRDVLFYVAQVLGGFFIINREGKLELRKYGKDPVMKVEQRHRFSSSFSDLITRYTAVSSTNKQTQIAEYYALDPDNGLTMNLGVNPLLQFGLKETREMLCRNILADLSVIRYVPFDSDTIGNPALDPGDVLTFAGGQADEGQITCITSIRQKIGGRQSLKCVGKNPRLAQAKSRNDKNISGLLNQIEDNAKTGKIGIHTFTNASVHEIGQTRVKLISIQFASSEENHMQFFAQVVVDVAADPVERSAEAAGTVVIPFPGGSGGTGSGTGGSDGTGETSDAGSSENDAAGNEVGNTSGNENTGSTDDVAGGSDSGSGTGSGSEVSVDVSLPVKWQEDGQAVCHVVFEFNNEEIVEHCPVETVQETNMITEAVNNILGLNPMGIYLKASGEYDNSVLWNGTLLPICPNMIGGILLFPAVLEEKADHIYEQGKNLPVAYASNNVNSGSNVARGSLNQTESKKLDNGYKFVWEFTPSQGNGNIAAVALTSALGGQNAFGSAAGDASTFLLLKKVDIGDIPKAKQMTLFEAVELDFEKNLLYSITFGTSSVTITKIRIPVFNIGLNEKLDDTTYTVLEEQTLTTESFTFLGDYTKYGEFMDGHDGYWYGFSNEPNSSGDAKMVWIRISKKDYSFTEGSWTLSKAKLSEVGTRAKDGSYPERNVKCCVRKGYLYVPSYDKKGVYKINTANSADVMLIPLGFTSKLKSLGEAGSCEVYMTLFGDMIVAGDFQITADDRVIKTQGSTRFEAMATPLFQYKNFVFMWGGSYGKEHRCAYLLTPYLASINNLSSAVVKNTDKTMKITYTLTEETM